LWNYFNNIIGDETMKTYLLLLKMKSIDN